MMRKGLKTFATVGVEGSDKIVMLAGLGNLCAYTDEDGFLLTPKNFNAAVSVAEKIERMRKCAQPTATGMTRRRDSIGLMSEKRQESNL